MDYMDISQIEFYQSSEEFFEKKQNQRIVLMTTKGSISYTKFKFKSDDTILFGRESAGVPEKVHKLIKDRLKIPMNDKVRSLNIASSAAIVLAESLRQIKLI
jgi:tRNA (cytidine/uridine-2'-O-)-methyltransferase